MPPTLLNSLDPASPTTIPQAAELIRQGKLVILPTETVYGIAVNLLSAEARQRVQTLKHLPTPPGWVLHLPSVKAVSTYVPDLSPLARRLLQKAWPGPVGVQLPASPPTRETLRGILGDVASDLIIEDSLTLRCPDHPATLEVLAQAGVPVALVGASLPDSPLAFEPSAIPEVIASQVDAIMNAGPTRYRKISTLVRVDEQGLKVLRPGIIDERILHRLAETLILFICSGNTCRSPMAAAIAQKLLSDHLRLPAKDLSSKGLNVQSAGLHAVRGMRATPEAVAAAEELHAELGRHQSQPATAELLRRADLIYTMTDAHREEILDLIPSAATKTVRLDPDGDVEDPIGADQNVYRSVARRLQAVLQRRLEEMPL